MSKFYRCTFQFFKTDDGTFAQNVVCMEDASETQTLSQIGTTLDQQWWGLNSLAALRRMSTNVMRLEVIHIQRIDISPPPLTFPFSTALTVGNSGFNFLHQTLGLVFRIFDGSGGPAHRGRVYHYGTPTTFVQRQGPSPAGVTEFNILRDHWLNQFGPLPVSNLFWNIFHRDQVGAARFTRVTDIRLSPRLGVQRRRNFGVGM